MGHRRLTVLCVLSTFVAACSSKDAGTGGSRASPSSSDSAANVPAPPWLEGVAPLLLAPAHSNDRALVVMADSLAPDMEEGSLKEPGVLIGLDGSALSVRVALSSGSEGCVDAALQP